jgi:hypothetical protein
MLALELGHGLLDEVPAVGVDGGWGDSNRGAAATSARQRRRPTVVVAGCRSLQWLGLIEYGVGLVCVLPLVAAIVDSQRRVAPTPDWPCSHIAWGSTPRATTEDITRLGKWAGGEKLSVCVVLYCTIAALRAANPGRRDCSGGILLLDDPIGQASHGSLADL